MTAMPTRHGPATPRAVSVWSLVLLLLAIASWRTMAPERSARAMRRLVEARLARDFSAINNTRTDELAELRRLQQTIARERESLLQLREDVKKLNYSLSAPNVPGGRAPGALAAGLADLPHTIAEAEQRAAEQSATETAADVEPAADSESAANDTAATEAQGCSVVLAPVAAEAGLGTQTEHIWAHLTLARAIENSCVALPPIVAGTSVDGAPHYVPVHEVIDVSALADTGLRFVTLKACKSLGVSRVFSDGVDGAAATRGFSRYVARSDPILAVESTLVTKDTVATGFAPAPADAAAQGKHVMAARGEDGLYCAGLGRLAAPPVTDGEVVSKFAAAPQVATYVEDRFKKLDETLYVKMRWRNKKCDEAPKDHVCLGKGTFVHVKDYVNAVKTFAKAAGASKVYLAAPAHLPVELMQYFGKTLETVDPVVLQLEGDEFAASVVERELAVRAKAFVPDGGVWGDTVQMSRRYRSKETFDEGITSEEMMKRWSDAGSPTADHEFVPALVLEAREIAAAAQAAAQAAADVPEAEEPESAVEGETA